tara:strand:- start:604 stop:2199 length:1596 start_codon:yes stop_codon:yes gene_type:complete
MISKSLKNTSFISIFIFSILLSIILNYFFSVRFEENDDVVMLLISSGKYSGTIDNHLVFINFIFGSFLNLFYSFSTEIEWYTISFIALNTLAISLIAKLIFKSSYSIIFKIVLLLFLFSIFINFSVALQFTRTAAILSIAGLSVIYNTKYKYVGALVFVFGTLIRFEAAILILLISLPLFLLSTKNLKDYIFNKNFRIIIFTLLISIFFKMGDYTYYYIDSDWKSFMEYNELRGKINDNPNAKNSSLKLPKNILLQDYQLLQSAHTNLSAITYNELEQIYQSIDERSLWQKINNSKSLIGKYRNYLLLVTLVTFLFFYQNKEQRFKILLTFFIFMGLLFYISLNANVKPRVFYSAFFAVMFFLIYLNERRVIGLINLTIFILILSFSGKILYKSYKIERSNKLLENTFNKQSELINEYLKGKNKLIPFGTSYRIEHSNPFCLSSTFPSQKILFSGWLTNIPLNKDKFDSFKYYIDDYSLLINASSAEFIPLLISSSLLRQNNIKVLSKIIVNEQNVSIIEFRTDTTKANKK